MANKTVKELAKLVHKTPSTLKKQLVEAGLPIRGDNDIVTDLEQEKFVIFLKNRHGQTEKKRTYLKHKKGKNMSKSESTHAITISTVKQDRMLNNILHRADLEASFKKERWWWVADKKMLFDTKKGDLWAANSIADNIKSHEAALKAANNFQMNGLKKWKLPTKKQLVTLSESNTPLRCDNSNKILKKWNWFTYTGLISLASPGYITRGSVLPVYPKKLSVSDALKLFAKERFDLHPNSKTHDFSLDDFLSDYALLAFKEHDNAELPQLVFQNLWKNIDYTSTRLPVLDELCFTDINQGLWEFFTPKKLPSHYISIATDNPLRARDPAKDIRQANVAIDFGTSSTVVAIRQDGKDELLRIGMQAKDYLKNDLKADHFENPTVLEIIDFNRFMQAWQSEAYRPLVSWDDVHCSHEARTSFRNNNSNAKVVGSILFRLKQWATRGAGSDKTCLTDQQGFEHHIDHLQKNDPVKGTPISVDANYVFDPIELYAWYLGMYINWRNRGIFLNYYMTFPVNYTKAVKANMLSSFRRGLQRSLPYALTQDNSFAKFSVVAQASEPAAFSAAALRRIEAEPTERGVAYAVFDFGGGTTDFDYGIYRLPRETSGDAPENDEMDYDAVLEHFGASGDNFLGGEMILENLAYLVFKQNREACRGNQIAFTKPMDAEAFAGSEMLIAKTQAAFTNTTLMMTKLRSLWEKGSLDEDAEGAEKIKLVNRDGEAVDTDIIIKQDELITFIEQRIFTGLKSFFIEMKKAFLKYDVPNEIPETIHLFLAGNSSRSVIVQEFLGVSKNNHKKSDKTFAQLKKEAISRTPITEEPKKKANSSDIKRADVRSGLMREYISEVFDNKQPVFHIHLPFDAEHSSYAITAKTGVALGLLDLCPGEAIKVINHAENENNQDSPFQYFVGVHRLKKLKVCLEKSETYNEWKELAPIRAGKVLLVYTTSPEARSGNMQRGDSRLKEITLDFEGDLSGCKAFVRVVAPDAVEVCSAKSLADIADDKVTNLQRVVL